MKRSLAVLCLTFSLLCSAPAAVEILSATQVKVDGSPAGDLANALRAFPSRSAEILAALDVRLNSAHAEDNDNVQAIAAISRERDALQGALDEANQHLASLVEVVTFVQATALPADLKASLEDARQTKAEKQRAELEAQKAALDVQLAKLTPTAEDTTAEEAVLAEVKE